MIFHLKSCLGTYPIAGQSAPVTITALYSAHGDEGAKFFWLSVTLLPTAYTLSCEKEGYEGHWEKTSATFNLMIAVVGTTLKQKN